MKKIKKGSYIPQAWQREPERLTTSKLQLWSVSGVMLTAELDLERGKEMVSEGIAFVISSQAVGYLDLVNENA